MKDRLIVLGTGNAAVTRCYNTCFAIQTAEGFILCDAGGGNGILRQLEDAQIGWQQIHHLILTHAHSDHLLGAVWVIRMVATRMNNGKYEGDLHIYCDPTVREGLTTITDMLWEGCLGQLPEIYDGDNPREGKGCFAQAWSVGEILRVFEKLEELESN